MMKVIEGGYFAMWTSLMLTSRGGYHGKIWKWFSIVFEVGVWLGDESDRRGLFCNVNFMLTSRGGYHKKIWKWFSIVFEVGGRGLIII